MSVVENGDTVFSMNRKNGIISVSKLSRKFLKKIIASRVFWSFFSWAVCFVISVQAVRGFATYAPQGDFMSLLASLLMVVCFVIVTRQGAKHLKAFIGHVKKIVNGSAIADTADEYHNNGEILALVQPFSKKEKRQQYFDFILSLSHDELVEYLNKSNELNEIIKLSESSKKARDNENGNAILRQDLEEQINQLTQKHIDLYNELDYSAKFKDFAKDQEHSAMKAERDRVDDIIMSNLQKNREYITK